jgi:hypothetical protein
MPDSTLAQQWPFVQSGIVFFFLYSHPLARMTKLSNIKSFFFLVGHKQILIFTRYIDYYTGPSQLRPRQRRVCCEVLFVIVHPSLM